jgi:tetratricopeptide (TPR) repeat protein
MRRMRSMKITLLAVFLFISLFISDGYCLDAGLPALIDAAKPSIVIIYAYNENGELNGTGSGFFINEYGDIVTNYHVVKGASEYNDSLEIKVFPENIYKCNEIAAADSGLDLAIIKSDAPRSSIHPLPVSLSRPKQGERIFILGSPSGFDVSNTDGTISRIGPIRDQNDRIVANAIQINTRLDPGYSGGPVIDMMGNVVGVAFLSRKEIDISSAIPSDRIVNLTKNVTIEQWDNSIQNGVNNSRLIEARQWGGKGRAFEDINKYTEAIECYNKSLELDPSNAMIWNNKGWSLRIIGRPKEAVDCFNKALDIDPSYSQFWSNKGLALDDLEQYEDSLECLDRALEIDSSSDTAWNNKGLALRHMGRFNEAIKCYDMAIRINPMDAHAYSNKGAALYAMQKPAEALESLDKALELDPSYDSAWNNKGGILFQTKRYAEAVECLKNATLIDPTQEAPWANMAEGLYQLKRYEEALKCINKAIEINPESFGNWNSKSRILNALGREDDAKEAKEKSMKIINY